MIFLLQEMLFLALVMGRLERRKRFDFVDVHVDDAHERHDEQRRGEAPATADELVKVSGTKCVG